MKSNRDDHACTAVNFGGVHGILVAGGDDENDRSRSTSEFYNIKTGKWQRVGGLRVDRPKSPHLVHVSGRIFIIGGNTRQVEEFLPAGMKWARPSGLPRLRYERTWSPGVTAFPSSLLKVCRDGGR